VKAIRLHGSGAESLVYEEAPRPTPGAGEFLIAVHGAGVTPSELQWAPTSTLADGRPRPRPVVAKTLPLAEGRAAYARRSQGSTRGKIALRIAA